jgi:tol-pal system protein YbgF
LFSGACGVGLAGALLLATASCAGGKSSEERQLDQLRDEINHVQSESDTFESRLDKLEVEAADSRGEMDLQPPARALSAPIATPPLRVVRIGPEGTEEAGEAGEAAGSVETAKPEDGTERIRIAGSGEAVTVTDGKGGRKRLNDPNSAAGAQTFTNANIGPSLSTHSAGKGAPIDEDAKHSYDAAISLVNAKKYSAALDALAGFLVKWPDHPNADNAMYWRGQCYFAQGDYASAAKEMQGLLARFPAGNKAPDALLKLGMSEQRLGDADSARQHFDRLRRDFPRTAAAQRIPAGAQTVRPDSAPTGANPGDKQ